MSRINLIRFPLKNYENVTQLSQYIDVSFAYVNEKYEEIMQHVKCKDFMNLPNWQRKTGKSAHVYGWIYDFKSTPYDVNVTRIALQFYKADQACNFFVNIKHLNAIEVKYGIKPTIIHITQEDGVFVVEGDPVWQSNCWKVSLYMMYLRRCGHKDFNDPCKNSSDYSFIEQLKRSPWFEHNMLTNIHEDFDYVELDYDSHVAHSCSGFMSLARYQGYLDKKTGEIPIHRVREYGISATTLRVIQAGRFPNPKFQGEVVECAA